MFMKPWAAWFTASEWRYEKGLMKGLLQCLAYVQLGHILREGAERGHKDSLGEDFIFSIKKISLLQI